jgi:hypothetical protein
MALTTEQKAKAILEKMFEIADAGHPVGFEEDWGKGSITLHVGAQHTHCGDPGGTVDDLIDGLHRFLLEGYGLGFAIPLRDPRPEMEESSAPSGETDSCR